MPGWIAAAAAVVGGVVSAQGAKSAANTQANAANHSADIQQNMFNTINSQEAPYRTAGYGAQDQLNYLLGIGTQPGNNGKPLDYNTWAAQQGGNGTQGGYQPTPDGGIRHVIPGGSGQNPAPSQAAYQKYVTGFKQQQQQQNQGGGFGSMLKPFDIDTFHKYSPAYQFQLGQGQQGVLNADSGNAGALSGAAQKDLIGYNQSMADTSFNNAFNQYNQQQNNIYDRLSGIAHLGQNAAANTGAQGTTLAGNQGSAIANAGAAQAAGQVGAANAYSGAVSNASYLPWLMKGSSGGGGGGGGDPVSMNPAVS